MEALWDRIEELAMDKSGSGKLVPVEDAGLFLALAVETARFCEANRDAATVVFADAQTAGQVPQLAAVVQHAAFAACTGPRPESWKKAGNTVQVQSPDKLLEHRFLMVFSPSLSFAIAGVHINTAAQNLFRGGWTCERKCVESMLQEFAAASQLSCNAPTAPAAAPDAAETSLLLATRLMTSMVAHFSARQQDIAMDRHDLFSVLEILKAISSRRRAHDVLFVFVEQIARVIETNRCSIVQVWGGERKGRVQASHEDETVSDLVIDLEKYPEILHAMETRQKVVINDVARHRLTRQYARQLSEAGIRVLMVIPIVLFDPNVGSLFLRVTRRRGSFALREIGFCEIVAEAAGNALERAQLFERIQRANERLERLAVTDALTGLHNRRHFHQRLQEEYQRSKRYALPLACVMFDIDDFKKINDTYGHLQGDSVLREIAAQTNALIRKTDICARYGGEEFVIVMPQTGIVGARSQAHRLLEVLRTHKYPGLPPKARVTVSIGVAVLDLDTMDNCDALVAQADVALYEAKRLGKNRVVVAQTSGDKT
ncbi:MAG TPA: sensor domain-containing diguanylate cyclase [Candidatus Hydrogenedentes bacterium]|nr:sensor domain-containing diguanylate cyclase [Candidatus Hydrogenedentota bacterium]HQK74648.1 sensor domain-containing diguanylate cyclase [Candidatus Hydrogenedentota bacterium]HQM34398.1 sensor domain-containing diguanylate cyclase [Candidatus Hydrogenedentota bacterium]